MDDVEQRYLGLPTLKEEGKHYLHDGLGYEVGDRLSIPVVNGWWRRLWFRLLRRPLETVYEVKCRNGHMAEIEEID